MGDEPTPPPTPLWVQQLRADLKKIATAVGNLALGLDEKAKTDARRHEETQGMLLAILVENRPKLEIAPERPRRDSGDEHSDVFKVPTLPGVQVGMTRKAQREMLARIGKFAFWILVVVLSHIVAYFKLPHPADPPVTHSTVTLPNPAPPSLPAPSITVPALAPPPVHP